MLERTFKWWWFTRDPEKRGLAIPYQVFVAPRQGSVLCLGFVAVGGGKQNAEDERAERLFVASHADGLLEAMRWLDRPVGGAEEAEQ